MEPASNRSQKCIPQEACCVGEPSQCFLALMRFAQMSCRGSSKITNPEECCATTLLVDLSLHMWDRYSNFGFSHIALFTIVTKMARIASNFRCVEWVKTRFKIGAVSCLLSQYSGKDGTHVESFPKTHPTRRVLCRGTQSMCSGLVSVCANIYP